MRIFIFKIWQVQNIIGKINFFFSNESRIYLPLNRSVKGKGKFENKTAAIFAATTNTCFFFFFYKKEKLRHNIDFLESCDYFFSNDRSFQI